ncbi:hypothetical protein BJ991_000011 [Microbacterium immunditiarum]|uniref:Transposase IS4-like domain-containing protein n=1 Tax=Microbacterium immunditiarum TaxID=337480 RepID=A0A7Y9GK40_9MICO|nr:hypothetical protein [Microbacterium immunditiarum]NYE17983.1 hypothetical protein [Microbacterium immunditiarum]
MTTQLVPISNEPRDYAGGIPGGISRLSGKEAIERPEAELWLGAHGYVTNLSIATASAAEVVTAYHDLFQVEATFRMAKTDLRARPIFASTADSIHAHPTIVFTALAISRHLYKSTGFTVRRIVRAVRSLRDITISIDCHELTAPTPPQREAAEILVTLHP